MVTNKTKVYEPFSFIKEKKGFNPYFLAATAATLILLPLTYIVLSKNSFELPSDVQNGQPAPRIIHNSDFTLNSTLGFGKIYFMELPHRQDRMSTMALQATVLDIDYETLDAFNAEPYKANGYVGMVPTKNAWNGGFMGTSHYGCYQAHVNALRKVLEDKVETALILEGDIAFDVDIKRILTEALPNLDKSFKIHEKTIKKSEDKESTEDNSEPFKINHSDPYQSKKWDIFMLTTCADKGIDEHEDVIYDDELSLGGGSLSTPAGKRRVGRSGGPICLAAYAVTKLGAARILSLLSLDSSMPVDFAMKETMVKELVTGYTINPPVAGTWIYKADLGLDGRQSNIDKSNKEFSDADKETIEKAWRTAKGESLSIWEMRYPKNLNTVLTNIRSSLFNKAPNNGLEY